jgi:hypothetical protein
MLKNTRIGNSNQKHLIRPKGRPGVGCLQGVSLRPLNDPQHYLFITPLIMEVTESTKKLTLEDVEYWHAPEIDAVGDFSDDVESKDVISEDTSDAGDFHDQGDAKWIVIRGHLRGHNDTLFGRPTPRVDHPQGVFGVFSYC